jgi:predicted transport protein|tara:strand:+ start:37 stop:249 length:213 start_codon:yes stop_codon:yes gene_type:complete
MAKLFEDFYESRMVQLNRLQSIDNTEDEAKQIKINMGYDADADYWDISKDVADIGKVADWFMEWREKEQS